MLVGAGQAGVAPGQQPGTKVTVPAVYSHVGRQAVRVRTRVWRDGIHADKAEHSAVNTSKEYVCSLYYSLFS